MLRDFDIGLDLTMFVQMEDVARSEYAKIKQEIDSAQTLSKELVDKGKYKTIKDIENSIYAKKYKYGIIKFKTIFTSHRKENIDIVKKIDKIQYNNYKCPKQLYELIQYASVKYNIDKYVLLSILYYENGFCSISKFDEEKSVNILSAFNAWAIVKKTYPHSKTTAILKEKERHTLEEILTAYILLSWEVDSIKDYNDNKTALKEIYDLQTNGLYCPTHNRKIGDYGYLNEHNFSMLLITEDFRRLFGNGNMVIRKEKPYNDKIIVIINSTQTSFYRNPSKTYIQKILKDYYTYNYLITKVGKVEVIKEPLKEDKMIRILYVGGMDEMDTIKNTLTKVQKRVISVLAYNYVKKNKFKNPKIITKEEI